MVCSTTHRKRNMPPPPPPRFPPRRRCAYRRSNNDSRLAPKDRARGRGVGKNAAERTNDLEVLEAPLARPGTARRVPAESAPPARPTERRTAARNSYKRKCQEDHSGRSAPARASTVA